MAADPIHQFRIIDLFPVAKIGHTEIVFTNSAAFMLLAVVVITAFLIIGTARRGLVPSRLQSAAELSYEFVASTVRSTAGSEGMKFFPFVFTLFMFCLLYTSDAADEEDSVDLGGRRIIKKKKKQ